VGTMGIRDVAGTEDERKIDSISTGISDSEAKDHTIPIEFEGLDSVIYTEPEEHEFGIKILYIRFVLVSGDYPHVPMFLQALSIKEFPDDFARIYIRCDDPTILTYLVFKFNESEIAIKSATGDNFLLFSQAGELPIEIESPNEEW
jgi:hypothetical protein